MDSSYDDFCHGCLNSERKLSLINDKNLKECFLYILKNVSTIDTVQLCFECKAILVKIKKFQDKVVFSAHKLLNECVERNLTQTSLKTITLYSFSLYNDTNEKESQSGIKADPDGITSSGTAFRGTDIENNDNMSNELEDFNYKTLELNKVDTKDNETHYEVIETIKEEPNDVIETDIDNNDELEDFADKTLGFNKVETNKGVYKEVKLSKKEIADERQVQMASEDYVNAMCRCDMCVITFTNSDDLDEHVNKKHDAEAKYQCTICKCAYNSMISYRYHQHRHRLRFQCNACEKRFVYKRDVIKHYNTVHCRGFENFTTDNGEQGGSNTPQRIEPSETLDLRDKTEIFSCDVCSKEFRWKASLRKHLERHSIESGQKRKPYCEPCKLYFATTSNLKKHVRASSKHQIQLKLRKLNDSNIEDKVGAIKEIQSNINSSREMFACAQCDKRFQWHGNLLRHINNHKAKASGELVCVPCNRTFSSIATYRQHMKISKKHVTEDDFKYMCSECGKRFADKTRLKDHVDWEHLKNFVHTCAECHKAFKTRTSLYLHKQVVHLKDRSEHLCDHCGKHFPNHSKLRLHIRAAHSSVAAYKCSSCGAKFAWHSCLSRHIRRLHKKQD